MRWTCTLACTLILLAGVAAPASSLDRNGYYTEWQKLYEAKQFDKAVTLLEKAVRDYPQEAQFEVLLGYCFTMLHDLEKALPHYEAALRISPNDKNVIANAYSGYVSYAFYAGTATKSWDNAVPWLKKAEALEPENAEIYYYEGLALCNAGRTEATLTALEIAFARDPSLVNGRMKENLLYEVQAGMDRALSLPDLSILARYCHLALAACPKDPQVTEKAFQDLWGSQDPDYVRSLLRAGARIDDADGNGQTPLMWAAKNWKPVAIPIILGAGADPNVKTPDGKTALDLCPAAQQVSASYAHGILAKCTDGPAHDPSAQDFLRLMEAVRGGSLDQVQAILSGYADVSVNGRDGDGITPLMAAARLAADPRVITALLKAGASIDDRDTYQRTALMWASEWSRSPDVVAKLIDAGADQGLRCRDGRTALDYADCNPALRKSAALGVLEKGASAGRLRPLPGKFQSLDTGLTVSGPADNPFGYPQITTAPMTALDDGGYAVFCALPGGKARIIVYSRDNQVSRTEEIGDGGMPAGIASWEDQIAFLYKTGKNRLDFRVLGRPDQQVVIMDNADANGDARGASNSGKGLLFWNKDTMVFGTEAMLAPITLGRGNLLFASGACVASFAYANNFNASGKKAGEFQGVQANQHWGEMVIGFPADSVSETQLVSAWGVSHSMDLRTAWDGECLAHISIGDVYPADFKFVVFDKGGGTVSSTNLFSANAYPDALMGKDKHGKPLYGVAGGPPGVSAKLGELLPVSRGQFLFTYAIRPGRYENTYLSANGLLKTGIDELGVMRLDSDGKVIFRKKLLPGADVEFLKTVRYGDNFLLAWKQSAKPAYRMMIIDADGAIVDGPSAMPEGVFFNASDPCVRLKDGDIVWTAAGPGSAVKEGRMVIFRLKAQ